jgi:hypothetical protein
MGGVSRPGRPGRPVAGRRRERLRWVVVRFSSASLSSLSSLSRGEFQQVRYCEACEGVRGLSLSLDRFVVTVRCACWVAGRFR